MRLIGSLTSPYVRKVRVVLAEKKLDYKFELDDPWSADNQVSASNPLGKVPCLVLEGGEALFDSRVIVEYVDTLSPVGRLIPERGRERAEVRTWLEANGKKRSRPDEVFGEGLDDDVRVAIEAGVRQGWDRWLLGERGREAKAAFIGMSSFGASAPYDRLYKEFGITAEATVAAAKALL